MTSSNEVSQGTGVNAVGGVVIGVLLACLVVLGGLPLVLGATASAEYTAFPARVDQRIAGNSAFEITPDISFRPAQPVVVAEVRPLVP